MAKFRKVEMTINKLAYGHYMINANYKGKEVNAVTTDSECFYYLEDDNNKEKHQQAKRHAYNKIVNSSI